MKFEKQLSAAYDRSPTVRYFYHTLERPADGWERGGGSCPGGNPNDCSVSCSGDFGGGCGSGQVNSPFHRGCFARPLCR